MALRDLSTAVMVCLTTTWVDEAHADHKTLIAQPQSAGLMPSVIAAHRGLLSVQSSAGADPNARLTEIKTTQLTLNQRHGQIIQGLWGFLSSVALLTADADKAASLTSLRDRLLVGGLTLKVGTYREKAGAAVLSKARITPADETLLRSIPTLDGTLFGAVEGWFEVSSQLGALENERAALEPQGATPADALKARNNWIRAITAVRAAVATVEELPPALAQVLQCVEDAEIKAAARVEIDSEEDPEEDVVTRPTDDTQPQRNAQPVAPANDTHPTPVVKVA